MSNRYSIGQLVVMQNGTHHTEHNGQLAIIIGALILRRGLDASTMKHENRLCYEVRVLCTPTRMLFAEHYQLRPLEAPRTARNGAKVKLDPLGRPIRRYLRVEGNDGEVLRGRELSAEEVRIVEAAIERQFEQMRSRDERGDDGE